MVGTGVAYAFLLQGQDPDGTVTPWQALRGAPTWVLAVLAATIAATAAAAWLRPSRTRRGLLLATAVVLFGVGFVALFSIGLPLMLAAAFTIAAAATRLRRRRDTAVPLSSMWTRQPFSWTKRWWRRQSETRLGTSVGPRSAQWSM